MRPAAEENVIDSLPSLSAVAAWAAHIRHSSVEEEVVEADLLSPQLYQQRALPLVKPFMKLEYLFGGHRCMSVGRSAFRLCSRLVHPCPLFL
jgi:hypothetical protein